MKFIKEKGRSCKRLGAATVVWMLGTACANPASFVIEPLRIINWSPNGGSPCVGTDTTIIATFSHDVAGDSLTEDSFYLLDASGNVPTTISYDQPTFTARLEPIDSLGYDRLYTAIASTGIRSGEIGQLSVEIEASFKTVARTGCSPGVECQLPSDCPDPLDICANIGICIDECVTDRDCFLGTCASGVCNPSGGSDGAPGGDPMPGGDAAGGD